MHLDTAAGAASSAIAAVLICASLVCACAWLVMPSFELARGRAESREDRIGGPSPPQDRVRPVLRRRDSPQAGNRSGSSQGSPSRMSGSPRRADLCAEAQEAAPAPRPRPLAFPGASSLDVRRNDATTASDEALGDSAPEDASPRSDNAPEDAPAREGHEMYAGSQRLASPRSGDEPPARSSESAQVEHDSRPAPSLDQEGTAPMAVLQQHDVPLHAPTPHSAGETYRNTGDAALVESKRRHRSVQERRARREDGKLQSPVNGGEAPRVVGLSHGSAGNSAAPRVLQLPDSRTLFAPVDLNHSKELSRSWEEEEERSLIEDLKRHTQLAVAWSRHGSVVRRWT